jgi:hypothetical protein
MAVALVNKASGFGVVKAIVLETDSLSGVFFVFDVIGTEGLASSPTEVELEVPLLGGQKAALRFGVCGNNGRRVLGRSERA